MDMLVVRGPMFHSRGDEEAFFWWMRRIRAVQKVSNRGQDLHIQLRPGDISADERREFRSVFYRYGMDTSGLEGL
ncbi:MAG: hypothetical protein U1C74_02590 [Phenylobacterium sp.]|nr:hypothetical protein [Phenylobacterium sp.]